MNHISDALLWIQDLHISKTVPKISSFFQVRGCITPCLWRTGSLCTLWGKKMSSARPSPRSWGSLPSSVWNRVIRAS